MNLIKYSLNNYRLKYCNLLKNNILQNKKKDNTIC